MKEVEILVQVLDDKNTVLKKLNKFGKRQINKTLDVYFYDPKRLNLKPDRKGSLRACFRLREKEEKFFMAYKVDNFDKKNKWIYSDEHEIEISDLRIAENIIEHLGLEKLVKIDNKKYIYSIKNYEMVFEEVKDLGLFLEVERLNVGDKENPREVKKEIWKFIKSLGIKIGDELNLGKPELMLRKIREQES